MNKKTVTALTHDLKILRDAEVLLKRHGQFDNRLQQKFYSVKDLLQTQRKTLIKKQALKAKVQMGNKPPVPGIIY